MQRSSTAAALLVTAAIAAPCAAKPQTEPSTRPNILWISSEDNGPQLGAYGDAYADTPTLDRLAREGVTYTNASSNAPVCAPARSTLITGMYAPSIGSQHMRSVATLPANMRFFPAYLRENGYYCTNNAKEDYNLKTPRDAWDESGREAHWRKRATGQPFFSVFNITVTHESRIWPRGDGRTTHDPADAPLPPYHPDTTEVRRDWAQYYDNMTRLDRRVAEILAQLQTDGLAEDTIVFYFADHGPGMPRGKRWLYQSGLHVPLIIRFPEKYRSLVPGSTTDRLVSFVDFGPTVLSLAGVPIPGHMQGRAFLGPQERAKRTYTFGYRDRMDERYDMSRSVFDGRYKYIRNYMPHRPYAQHLSYMYRMPTMRVWQQLYDDGKLTSVQARFFQPKAREELYDVASDPHEVVSLVESPEHRGALARLRWAHRQWMIRVRDSGLLPEIELRRRSAGGAEYDTLRDATKFPLQRLLDAADQVGNSDDSSLRRLGRLLDDAESAVRYWGAVGCIAAGAVAESLRPRLNELLADPAAEVRMAAAEALCGIGDNRAALEVLAGGLEHERFEVRLQAAIALDELDDRARAIIPAMRKALQANPPQSRNSNHYIGRVIEKALADLGESSSDGRSTKRSGPFQATGIRICEVDADSAVIWTRLTKHADRVGSDGPMPVVHYQSSEGAGSSRRNRAPVVEFPGNATIETIEGAVPGVAGEVRIRYRARDKGTWQATDWRGVDVERDFTAQVRLSRLEPSTEYTLEVQSRSHGETKSGQTIKGRLRTAPAADRPARVVFTVSTGQAYRDQDAPRGGFRIYDSMRALSPDFFVHTGDIVYYDRLAKTLPLARWHWARTYSLPTNVEFHRVIPSYFIKDDHDTWMNDCWPTQQSRFMGDFTFKQGCAVFLEQVGMGERTFRTVRWGKDLQIWLVEGRDYRSPNDMPDGPEKTIWGDEQKNWFQRTVRESDAAFRVLFSPTPLVGPDRSNKRDNHANEAFAHEGRQLREFIAAQKNMVIVCGDRHWQYVSEDSATGVREYCCGPASNAHAGGWSNDKRRPEHRYLNVTGGFLAGIVERVNDVPQMTFRHYSVDGELLNEDKLQARK